jgi:hypothetical protein
MRHRPLGLEHAVIHVEIDDLGTVLDLLAGDQECRVIILFEDHPPKARRAGDVGTFADIDEAGQ